MINVIDFINTNRDRYVRELKDYLAIPSISALPEHQADMKRCAEWTGAEMTRVGDFDRRDDVARPVGHQQLVSKHLR